MTPATERNTKRWTTLAILHGFTLLALFAYAVWENRPVAMHDLQLGQGERLRCVSYAPYRLPGQTPFDPELEISAEQIRADLTELARMSECVRIYSIDQGLGQVPTIARELGLKVLLGAWIGADPQRNQRELEQAIAIANAHTDVVALLIVGNEVLLRRERTAEQMQALLEQARLGAHVPVTYADVWEFWVKNAALAQFVDVVTVHILPFWENDPVGVDAAIEHVIGAYREVDALFDQPLLIGETGWPSAGRQREASRPSRVNQARFVREFVHHAHAQDWNYNLIEAIDQPWKRRLEGTVGGFWGILDVDLGAKFPLSGPVRERDSLLPLVLACIVGSVALLTLAATNPATRRARPAVASAIAGGCAGVVMWLEWEHALNAYRTDFEWAVLGGIALLGVALLALGLLRADERAAPSIADTWAQLRVRRPVGRPHALLLAYALLRALLLFAAAIAAILLVADPRYRDFPTLLYVLPGLTLAAHAATDQGTAGVEERLCAAVIALCVIGRWLPEPFNPQAIAWLVTALLIVYGCRGQRTRQHQQ